MLLSPFIGIYGVAAAVLAGGVAQLGMQLPVLARKGLMPRVRLNLKHPGLIRTAKLMLITRENYKLIIVPEKYTAATRPIREEVMRRGEITPFFALIPGLTMETGMRMEELQAVVSLAIGTKLEI